MKLQYKDGELISLRGISKALGRGWKKINWIRNWKV
jgi:hypothetical protein